jgi:hypothetical protein
LIYNNIIYLHAEKFLKKLGGRKDVEDALRLDRLTPEEARMAAAKILKITREIDDKVEGVDHKVVSAIQGELYLH